MKPSSRNLLLLVAWFSLVLLACSLASPDDPPTLVPRDGVIAATPQSTIGYATRPPQNTPPAQSPEAPQVNNTLAVYNILNRVEVDRMMLHIDSLVDTFTRHVNSPTNLPDTGIGAAFNYIMSQLLQLQAQAPQNFTVFPEGHTFEATFNGITSDQRNAVAVLSGTDAGAGVVIIGAHYDSRTDDLNDAESFAPGAADNGSGVAAVLEMARVLSNQPQRATIIFVLFAAEEVNRQGSRAFVRDYVQPRLNDTNVTMINIDTIGNWNDPEGNINADEVRLFSAGPNDSPSRQLARTLHFLSYNYALDLEIDLQDGLDREGRYGDQESFVERGYGAVRFIEAFEDPSKREGRDTIDGVEPTYLEDATHTILGTLIGLAGGPRPPQNITLREAGGGFSTLHWEPIPDAVSYIVALRRPNSLEINQQFPANDPFTAEWDGWKNFETVSIAAVDANGRIGPLSAEFRLPTTNVSQGLNGS